MISTTAVIFIHQCGVPAELQESACLEYCQRKQYTVDSVCSEPGDAAALVESGSAGVIVAAFRRSEDRAMGQRVHAAGGRVEYTRTPPAARPLDSDDLAAALHERGNTVEQIAQMLGESTQEITRSLSGLRQPGTH
jgi:hypothetical protein